MDWMRRNWLYLLLFSLPFERIPSFDLPVGGITIRASFLIALLAVMGGAVAVVRRRNWRPSSADTWLLAYGGVMALSLLVAEDKGRSAQVIVATGLLMGLAMVIERNLYHFNLQRAYRWLLGGALVACAIGLYQFLGDSLGLPTYLTGLKDIYTKHVFGFPRVQSVALEPLYFASFLLLPLMLLLTRIYIRPAGWKSYAALWFIVTAFALTLSRGGIYAALAGLIVVAVVMVRHGSWRRLAMAVATIMVGAGTALGMIALTTPRPASGPAPVAKYVDQSTTLTSGVGSADSDRSVNRKLAIQAFKEHPWLGVGIGNFGAYAQDHDPRYVNNSSVIVNNEYLEILAETGIAGLGALAGFVATLLWWLGRSWTALGAGERWWAGALFAALAGAAVQFYAFSTLYIIHIWVAAGLLLGLTWPKQRSLHKAER